VRTKVWGVNLKNLLENSREAVSVSTICDEYCSKVIFYLLESILRAWNVIITSLFSVAFEEILHD